MKKRIAIIGAGPIGLEAALTALERDHPVQVYERGEIGRNIREWGHVRMFTSFAMNSSSRGRAFVSNHPPLNALLTGKEYVDHYLAPLAESMRDLIHTGTEVRSVARVATLKSEKLLDPARAAMPFRLLLRDAQGNERMALSDVILDCSGVWQNPNPAGDGGMPAAGEAACREFIHYGIPDVSGAQFDLYEGKSLLVVGSGHSAATVIRDLGRTRSRIVWITRREHRVQYVKNDPLIGRRELQEAADNLVKSGRVEHLPEQGIHSMHPHAGRVSVTFTSARGKESIDFDRIIVCTGFRPNLELARELQAQTCWATEASFRLALKLLGEAGPDAELVPDMLAHPEPGYFALGIKSFGRAPNFLIQTGLAQVETAFSVIS